MYLLEGLPAPDHASIARFRTLHFSCCSENILAQISEWLYRNGHITGHDILIDGTKIESCANKYTFVWKKAALKSCGKLQEKAASLVQSCEESYGLSMIHDGKVSLHTMKRLRKKLYRIRESEGIVFVNGSGKRKTPLQKDIETLEEYIGKLKEYVKKIHVCEERNKHLEASKTFLEKRQECLERITGEEGTMLRMNRSIRAEGSFSETKDGMGFRRYLSRGKKNVLAESIIVAMARNINKLHAKIQSDRTDVHLYSLKEA